MRKRIYTVAGCSDRGTVLPTNQDNFMYKLADTGTEYAAVLAVADGVGGLEQGELASATVISNINRWWESEFKSHYENRAYLTATLEQTLQRANKEILEMGRQQKIKMATTISLLLLYHDEAIILHVGDSRIYRYTQGWRGSRLEQLTCDHSKIVEKCVDGHLIKKSMLTECLGYRETFSIYKAAYPIEKRQIYILGSDGIYKTMTEPEISSCIRTAGSNMEQLCSAWINQVKNNGERDNITIIAMRAMGE